MCFNVFSGFSREKSPREKEGFQNKAKSERGKRLSLKMATGYGLLEKSPPCGWRKRGNPDPLNRKRGRSAAVLRAFLLERSLPVPGGNSRHYGSLRPCPDNALGGDNHRYTDVGWRALFLVDRSGPLSARFSRVVGAPRLRCFLSLAGSATASNGRFCFLRSSTGKPVIASVP